MNEEKNSLIEMVEKEYNKFNRNNNDDENKKYVIGIVVEIIEKVCENENVSIASIQKIYDAHTSDIFRIGDKVIKIGKNRYTNSIPNNPYIVKPLIRKYISKDDKTNGGLFVEVTERVETFSSYDDVTEDQLFELYSKLRDMGIEWLDIHYGNVGILLKDNIIHWNNNFEPSPSSTTMTGNPSNIVLKKEV